jgi:hypothetical protein
MSIKTPSVQDDLAFMRALVEGGGAIPAAFGETCLAAGLIYGLQILIVPGAAMMRLARLTPPGRICRRAAAGRA